MDRFNYQERPLDWVADCLAQRCAVTLYRGDECIIDEDGDHYCSAECYVRATGANKMIAGTEEYA